MVSVAVSVPVFRFQSTPPVKAATPDLATEAADRPISIHAAREGGDRVRVLPVPPRGAISIHAAREGGDAGFYLASVVRPISIHAAREGGDVVVCVESIRLRYFNPRRP